MSFNFRGFSMFKVGDLDKNHNPYFSMTFVIFDGKTYL